MSADDDRLSYLADGVGDIGDEFARVEFDEIRALLAEPGLWDEPVPDLEDRVVAAIVHAADSNTDTAQVQERPTLETDRPESPPVSATGAAHDVGSDPAEVVDLRSARDRRRRTTFFVAAAAAVIVVASAAVVVVRGGGDDAETFTMSAEATELAPNVTGEINLTKTTSGWEYAFNVNGFKRLDSGRFYQAWVKSDDGILVPIGTFNEGTNVVLWSGVPPREFPTLTVTEESADGDQTSSGRRVLVATLDD